MQRSGDRASQSGLLWAPQGTREEPKGQAESLKPRTDQPSLAQERSDFDQGQGNFVAAAGCVPPGRIAWVSWAWIASRKQDQDRAGAPIAQSPI